MTYYAGAWEYGGGNGMQVAMDVTWSAVTSASTSVTATVKFYTDNQYAYDDNQTLNISNNLGSNYSFLNNDGSSEVYRTTRYYTWTYATGSYGVSPGNVTFSATIEGAYNSVTPSVSKSIAIPARPGAPPTVTSFVATAGIRSVALSWSGSGDPGIYQYNVYRNNDPNQLIYASTGTSVTDTVLGNSQSVYYIVYALNAAGQGYLFSNTVVTKALPTSPASFTANSSVVNQITLTWGASNGDGYPVTYTIKRGSTADPATHTQLTTTTSLSYTDTTVQPATTYFYSIKATTSVGDSPTTTISSSSIGGVVNVYKAGGSIIKVVPKVWNGSWISGNARVWDGFSWIDGK